jgi:hypothetical protein
MTRFATPSTAAQSAAGKIIKNTCRGFMKNFPNSMPQENKLLPTEDEPGTRITIRETSTQSE